jgi:hypothetical protein
MVRSLKSAWLDEVASDTFLPSMVAIDTVLHRADPVCVSPWLY